MENIIPIIELKPNGSLNNIALVTAPAIEELFLTFSDEVQRFRFEDDEKHLVTGPVMIPDRKILRIDLDGNPYYVWFSKETIEELSQTFMRDMKNRDFNLQHAENVRGIYVTESWLTGKNDKSKDMGFDLPEGSWMMTVKIEDPLIWERIKSDELRGFSIDGFFQIVKEPDYEAILQQVNDIINNYEEDEQ